MKMAMILQETQNAKKACIAITALIKCLRHHITPNVRSSAEWEKGKEAQNGSKMSKGSLIIYALGGREITEIAITLANRLIFASDFKRIFIDP